MKKLSIEDMNKRVAFCKALHNKLAMTLVELANLYDALHDTYGSSQVEKNGIDILTAFNKSNGHE
jgi:hypothetical protein